MFENGADFSNMINEQIKVSDVIQKAFIKVNRDGTKAAVVTGMICELGCCTREEVKRVELNRPFIYAIVNVDTGLPVFVGSVNKLEGKPLEEDEY